MPRFVAGQDVVVDFEGRDHPGEVIRQSNGYVMCTILTDPLWDYGSRSAVLGPTATVCVPDGRVRLAKVS